VSYQFHQPGPYYQNPTYPRSFPDPFVLKYNGEYFAYCTGQWDDGRIFGVLHSKDLLNWTPLGGAMAELEKPEPFYWAPEVTYWNGTFYLYYSAGNETFMQLRVATSDRPDGGFKDAGVRLTKEDFAIDAHVFFDDDGQRYLFYATDFLEHTHVGTGVVVDRMVDWFTLAGEPRPVVRAKYDWQVYDPERKEKGGVRWHTVEGPFVIKRKGRYFMMFSGGNWQQPTYGVSFALTRDLTEQNEWRQFSDGRKIMPILRTDEHHQVGPGHNSVIRGPDNRDLYCVYHYWHEGNRVLAVNRMDFAGPRIFVESKPYLPKSVPLLSSRKYRFEEANWSSSGSWEFSDNSVKNSGGVPSAIRSGRLPNSFLCEFSFQAGEIAEGGRFGFRFERDAEVLGGLFLCLKEGAVLYEWVEEEGERQAGPMVMGIEFLTDALHRVTIETDGSHIRVKLDDTYLSIEREFPSAPAHLSLFTDHADVTFSGFELTEGFEDRFESEVGDPSGLHGWTATTDDVDLIVRDQELIFTNLRDRESIIYKGEANENFEFTANIRLKGPAEPGCSYGFVLSDEESRPLAHFEFSEVEGRFYLANDDSSSAAELPFDFNTRLFYQFRFRKQSGRLYFDIETIPLGSVAVSAPTAKIGIFSRNASVALEMVRLTVINT
jgi:GH43 family beta-xylosidase